MPHFKKEPDIDRKLLELAHREPLVHVLLKDYRNQDITLEDVVFQLATAYCALQNDFYHRMVRQVPELIIIKGVTNLDSPVCPVCKGSATAEANRVSASDPVFYMLTCDAVATCGTRWTTDSAGRFIVDPIIGGVTGKLKKQ